MILLCEREEGIKNSQCLERSKRKDTWAIVDRGLKTISRLECNQQQKTMTAAYLEFIADSNEGSLTIAVVRAFVNYTKYTITQQSSAIINGYKY